MAKCISVIIALALIACGKNKSEATQENSADLPGYHKVVYSQSGRPIYMIISMPTDSTLQIRKYHLFDGTNGGTFSIDRATVTKLGHSWTLTFSNSDCVADGTQVGWDAILIDPDNLRYSLITDPSTVFNFPSTEATIDKVDQYQVETYSHSSTICD